MRPVKVYTFKTGTKLAFTQLGVVVSNYLRKQSLENHSFLYNFYNYNTADDDHGKCSCMKISKDLPAIGIPRLLTDIHGTDVMYLSNIDTPGDIEDEDILPLMGKIHRNYGFASADIWWFDVDFFGSYSHYQRDLSQDPCRRVLFPDIAGSGIRLHRDRDGAWLELSVDLIREGQFVDPSPYYESMKALLPGIRCVETTKFYLSSDELVLKAKVAEAAKHLVKKANAIVYSALDEKELSTAVPTSCSFAKAMKKFGKAQGYKYSRVKSSCVMAKRTSNGNAISVTVIRDRPDMDSGVDVEILLQGAIFSHSLGIAVHAPINQNEVDLFVQQIMRTVVELEKELIPAIEALYPPTPSWLEHLLPICNYIGQ